tara:strand:+ start:437 stop:805 length:369 start_codon:yes stop_codon:yes gene_type:complete
MMLTILNLNPVNMGNDQQEIADWVGDHLGGEDFGSKDDFNEGEWIERACKALGWAFTPQTGGFSVDWGYRINISGAWTVIPEEEMEQIATDLGITDDQWSYFDGSDLAHLIEKKSHGHYKMA